MTPGEQRQAAADRMEAAKRQFSDAARAALMRRPDAPDLVRQAVDAVTEARAALRALPIDFPTKEPNK